MDCNKEEASRAKEIAESKMHSRDFVGAKKLLLKALQLSPDIENASHMLTVCEVHCSAGSLVNGQTDHYGVLQVEVSADEALIRKQYRRLALLLHPDKNKFAGAEAAFKLVGEAYKVLSDQANRQAYDLKRRMQMRVATSWQPSQNSRNPRRYTAPTINVSKNQFGGLKQQDQHPPSAFFAPQCFWTMCAFCNNRFQYSRSWLNREVQCQKCFKKFFAFEVSPQNVPPPGSSSGFNWSQTGLHETAAPAQHSYTYGTQTNASQPSNPAPATKHEYGSGNKEERAESCGDGMGGNQKSVNTKPESKPSTKPLSGNSRRMRSRRVATNSTDSDSAESDSTDSISEVDPTVLDGGSTSGRFPRRSTRSKTNVTYKEDESEDDDFVCHSKKLRKVGSFGIKNKGISSPVVTNGVKMKTSETPIPEDRTKVEQTDYDPYKDNLPGVSFQERGMMPESKETVCKKTEKQVRASSTTAVGSRSRKPQTVSCFSYPDPEFFDFNKERHKSRFAKNQVWAVYDDDDGMPRFYALIQRTFGPGSKLQYVWLENNPTSAAEKAWVAAELPIACGNFTHGKICSTTSQQMFSHLVFSEKSIKNIYSFYPKKGEVWALFKEWDIGWSSAVERPRNYVYEIVQVVSDFAYGKDITVCHLAKVKGFRYVFAPVHDEGNTVIPSGQLLKFSHCIPCYNIREEREGIPRDSFELDPAALPESFLKIKDAVSADNVEVLDAKFVDPATVEDQLAGRAVNNNSSRHGQNVFETGSKTVRDQVSSNSDYILYKSNQAREQRSVDSEAPYNTEYRRGEAIGHDKQDPANGVAVSNEDDEDFSFNEEECANEEECTKSGFYNFQDVRAEENFAQGQIWALYSDIDEYPKYYAWIKKVGWEEAGFVSIKWLEHAPETEEEKLWAKNGLPFGCGRFKIVSGIDQFDTTDAFSHMVHAKPIKKNDLYEIYPNSGEIWALYKNWSPLWTSKDIGNAADYSLVEIIERNEYVIKAVTLTKVQGYNYVFMPEKRGVADVEISIKECLRFSHLIPAFRLTIQESGKLEGYWELDPDSIPKILLTTDSSV